MTTPQQAYQGLAAISKELAILNSIGSVLSWDRETNMPMRGANTRAEQNAYLSGQGHRLLTDPRVGELLSAAEAGDWGADPYSDECANLREWRHDYDRATKIPTSLVEEMSRTAVLAQAVWTEARRKSEFALFQPHLAKLIDLARQSAGYIGYTETPYDALLDEYEPGETTAHVRQIFGALREELVPLVQAVTSSPTQPRTDILNRDYPIDRQKLFGEAAAAALGYNLMGGRLDIVTHPFCIGIGPGDVRITTRYTQNFFNEGFFGILHEAGHGLYEQNLSAAAFGTPLGDAVGMGIHESQSRLWENFVGRGLAFWRHFFPRAQQTYPAALGDVSLHDFYFAVNTVSPSFIRVEADEVTYNLHIMLRFEIEQAIINGDLSVGDIPATWNELFKKYVGLKVPNDSLGCLQDVHWSFGGFGYFPTYALGTLYAAQFFDAARKAIPDLENRFATGDFSALLDWLRTNIHQHGKRYRSRELVERVTGQPPSHRPLMDYLRRKYGELYQISV
jgi:carboxypeptidase Taq